MPSSRSTASKPPLGGLPYALEALMHIKKSDISL